jgi:hypothetical protein
LILALKENNHIVRNLQKSFAAKKVASLEWKVKAGTETKGSVGVIALYPWQINPVWVSLFTTLYLFIL